ncbi:hypothetical protein LCGC14_1037650 [marine sediment metagenome]|uniref:Uncharacterized protein n=1 Tax=marine sediment metagenome TaxID=412755 RepID=A0A0F9NED3_9ZZZZ
MTKTTKPMKAKEIENAIFWGGINVEGGNYTNKEKIELIKEYARQKCKEQREICQEIFDNEDYLTGNVYLNAPKPKFD